MALFEVTDYDRQVYANELRDYLPENIVDIHIHVWRNDGWKASDEEGERAVMWPNLVAPENTAEDIDESYKLFFPDKKVLPLMMASKIHDIPSCHQRNDYMVEAMKKTGYPSLYYSHPKQSPEEIEKEIFEHGFCGIKSYLTLSPDYLPEEEIRILDFFTPPILEMANKHGLMIMLHIPRSGRFRDPVNVAQVKYICENYPNIRVVLAHVGRAYSIKDVGNAFEELKGYENLYYDFTANTSTDVFVELLKNVPHDRIMFGSDNPIIRMRMKRIDVGGKYINLIPPGLYGDPSQDSHLCEVDKEDADKITFFMYEEIIAMKRAIRRLGLGDDVTEKLFYSNGKKLIDEMTAITRK